MDCSKPSLCELAFSPLYPAVPRWTVPNRPCVNWPSVHYILLSPGGLFQAAGRGGRPAGDGLRHGSRGGVSMWPGSAASAGRARPETGQHLPLYHPARLLLRLRRVRQPERQTGEPGWARLGWGSYGVVCCGMCVCVGWAMICVNCGKTKY